MACNRKRYKKTLQLQDGLNRRNKQFTQDDVTEPFKYRHEALEEGKVYLVSD